MTTNAIILRGTYNECTQRMLFCFFELACMSADDQEIVGLIPTGSGSILRWRLIMGWCEGVVYLASPGRPTDIGLQLGKACYPCSR